MISSWWPRELVQRLVADRRLARAVVLVGVGVGLAVLFEAFAVQVVIPNADGATVILEGAALRGGALGLHGWSLSYDSFWTLDAPIYALFIAFTGLSPVLYHLVPAVLAAAVAVVALVLARAERRGLAGLCALGPIVALVVCCPADLAQFFLGGPHHVATVLACLIAFILLAEGRGRWRFLIAAVLLAAGLLGDLQAMSFGIVPVALVGVAESLRARCRNSGLRSLLAAFAGVGLALVVRLVAAAFGAFRFISGEKAASLSRVPANLSEIWLDLLQLAGIHDVAVGSILGESALVRAARVVWLVIVLAGTIGATVRGVRLVVRGPALVVNPRIARLELFLLAGFYGSLAQFFYLAALKGGNYSRYVMVPLIFATMLTGREIGALASALDRRRVRPVLGLLLAALIVPVAVATASALGATPQVSTRTALASFLEAHGLHVGLGDYPTAPVVTVASHGAVECRPVIGTHAGRLARWQRQTSTSWYAGVGFHFVVIEAHPWRGVTTCAAIATFGAPSALDTTGIYTVLVYNRAIHLSPIGSPGI